MEKQKLCALRWLREAFYKRSKRSLATLSERGGRTSCTSVERFISDVARIEVLHEKPDY